MVNLEEVREVTKIRLELTVNEAKRLYNIIGACVPKEGELLDLWNVLYNYFGGEDEEE